MAGGKVLAATVIVDGQAYPAGTTVPADVAEQITNPKAWVGGLPEAASSPSGDTTDTPSTLAKDAKPAKEPKAPKGAKGAKAPKEAAAPEPPAESGQAAATSAPAEPTSSAGGDPVPPPLTGAGSSKQAWADYAVAAAEAADLKIEIPDDAKRDEIIAALDDASIATKPKE